MNFLYQVCRKIFIKKLKKEKFLSEKCFKNPSFFISILVDSVKNKNKVKKQILFYVHKLKKCNIII